VAQSIFEPTDIEGRVRATELARGPWDPNAQHGGAPAALLVRAFERLPNPDDLVIARLTYEFLRPVPLTTLNVGAEIVRPGRRVQLLDGALTDESGHTVVTARALRIRRTDTDVAAAAAPAPPDRVPPGPEHGRASDFPGTEPMFATHAMEIRFLEGAFLSVGQATAWFHLRAPLIDGEVPSPVQRLAAAADFGNGISAALPWDGYVFINPDLTVYIDREPAGEWVCLQAETRIAAGGAAVAESALLDERGRVGRAVQALLVGRR
jgi:acyl-coenzyme A thioesterase PaaI-like protein